MASCWSETWEPSCDAQTAVASDCRTFASFVNEVPLAHDSKISSDLLTSWLASCQLR